MTLLCLPLLACLLPGAFQDVPRAQDFWSKAVASAPLELREDFTYLVEHMPQRDRDGLTPARLLEEVRLAQAGSARHGIWAVSYGSTGENFPLVWLPEQDYVHGVDVTERNAAAQASEQCRLLVKVVGGGGALLTVESSGSRASVELRTGLDDGALGRLLVSSPGSLRQALWEQFEHSAEALGLLADLQGERVRTPDRSSPFVVREVGVKPESGWPLVIAMHGGGGAPQELNDSQWRHMQVYYKDHPEVSGYRYLALRAPNNSWNGFYDDAIAALIRRLVLAQVLYEQVDPNAVHLIGYSHGGYGAFVIGPKLPDLFASVHSSAAAGTDGETKIANLFALNFSCMVGELDTAYERMQRCKEFAESILALAAANPGLYPAETEIIAGSGHGGLPDRDRLVRQLALRREPLPKTVIWEPSGADVGEQYWISIDSPADGQRVEARIAGQRLVLLTKEVASLSLWLDERLVDLNQPLSLVVNGVESSLHMEPSVANARAALARWHDPERIFTVRIPLVVD